MRVFYQNIPILILLTFYGCTAPRATDEEVSNADIPVINVENAAQSENEVLLSDVALDINYTPLETTNENLVSEIEQIEIKDSFIFISDSERLYQFDTSGRFIRQIGNVGRGPGEYSSIIHFSVNQDANAILLLGEYKFLRYDFQGNFIDELDSALGIDFIFYDNDRIAFYKGNSIETPVNITITDQDVNPLYKFENRYPRPTSNMILTEAPMYVFENNLYFKEHYNDTLFYIKDSVLMPHMIYDEDELLLDRNFELVSTGDVNDLRKKLEAVQDKWIISEIFESKRFVFTSYYSGLGPLAERGISILFDKRDSSTILVQNGKFENNLDSGFNLWPAVIYHDNQIISYVMPYELKTDVASEVFKNARPKFPEKKQELEELANSLDENDNPVLILVKLKE